MSEIVEYSDNLADIMAPFTRGQRLYLTLMLCGFNVQEAREKASCKQHTIEGWLVEPNFRAACDYVIEHKEVYQPHAMSLWAKDLTVNARRLIHKLIDKVDDWDTLGKDDKRYVWNAVLLADKLTPKGSGDGSYDEVILKRHRQVNG